ncbi:YopX family protein [Paenibacillus sp. FSL R5-0345]|uniref:YopX family protein n=1 Tax=Paenibacillus sp. FSL R5-0345 TaxID=1536770 RepID=UPI000694EECA|nr:YopX family protein [Paenibacillus sp. FSL R5-0345]
MSREIKFRAWDKIQKEMLFSSTGEYPDFRSDTQHIKIVHDGVLFADAPDMGYYGGGDWSYLDGEFEIMEYTGLKDKNGRKIYEGDLVYVLQWKNKYKVIFDDGMFKASGKAKFSLITIMGEVKCEVIGNIYETPELIHGT